MTSQHWAPWGLAFLFPLGGFRKENGTRPDQTGSYFYLLFFSYLLPSLPLGTSKQTQLKKDINRRRKKSLLQIMSLSLLSHSQHLKCLLSAWVFCIREIIAMQLCSQLYTEYTINIVEQYIFVLNLLPVVGILDCTLLE